ncbi:MAG TPA: hypothetical protein P5105_03620 [Victivallales bacterium]|nr:hypothetical protein [Victivallales bacterium]
MRKKKKRSPISDIWKKVEDSVKFYASKKINEREFKKAIEEASIQVNKTGMPDMIAKNFIQPYLQTSNGVKVEFTTGLDEKCYGVLPENNWSNVLIDPLGIYKFYSMIVSEANSELVDTDNFEKERNFYFFRELIKVPAPYFIFITILSKLSMMQEVFTAEKRGGKKITPEGLSMISYFPLLWALKQFEAFYMRVQNRDMRSDFGIIWHEGELVEKNKKQGRKK